jgi:hypothetical protein
VALVNKAPEDIRIKIIFKSSGVKKLNELAVTGVKLTSNFTGLVPSALRQNVALGPPGLPRWLG